MKPRWYRCLHIGVLAGLALASALVAPSIARAGETVRFRGGEVKSSGYLAIPKGAGTHPGVVVIHEWWGLNEWTRQQTDSLAAHGFVALAVDLYRGKVAENQEMAHEFVSGLVEEEAIATLREGADYLRGRDDVRAQALGVMGWCMGGKFAIRLAAADPGIRACVMYYGAPLTDEATIGRLQAAVLGNFGGEDKGPSPDQVRRFESALRKAGKKVDFKIYPGAGHAFANVNNPWGGYRASAAKDAWARTVAFFDRELKNWSTPKKAR